MHRRNNSEARSAKLSLRFNTFLKKKKRESGYSNKPSSNVSEAPLMDHRPFNKDETSLTPS